ncbi:MAG TPA: dTDP-4-dehydrorhamnose reductase [Candidatus Limnocylindrales bacterium]|nr:dTDP-4-dehydrorhamnose reductase [Candidatus Limnocylindrales bacterium]
MRILVTGAEGLLGTALVAEARSRGHELMGLGRGALDVTDAPAVRDALEAAGPDAVVHCAAYTAVDRAEAEPELARAVNRDGTRYVAEAAAGVGAGLVYVSTDYVFDGQKRSPYLPDDAPRPLSVYGRTKLEGEEAVRQAGGEALVVRTSWLYGPSSGFVPAILRRARAGQALHVVDDQRGRPTWAPHAAAALLDLLESGALGTWHVAGQGECTWFELAREALELEGLGVGLDPISTAEYGAAAPRPSYSVLDLEATEARIGRSLPHWRQGLRACLKADIAAAREA